MEINYLPSEIKVLPIDPVFSNWVNFNKVSIINCSTNPKSFKAIYFFPRNSKDFFFQFLYVHYFFRTYLKKNNEWQELENLVVEYGITVQVLRLGESNFC